MDKRIEKTLVSLQNAFYDLLMEKSYKNITIQDILDKSKVSRSTFYKHYKTKEDILLSIINDIFEHVFSHSISSENTHDFSKESVLDYSHLITHILYHLSDNKKMISAIINNDCSLIFFDEIRKQVLPLNEKIMKEANFKNQTIPYKLLLEIATEDFIVLIKHRFKHNCEYSPETIASHYFSLITFQN